MTEAIEQPYAGGLNFTAEDIATKEGTVPDAANVHFGMGGRVRARRGSVTLPFNLPVAASASRELYVVEKDVTAGTPPAQLVYTGGRVYSVSGAIGAPATALAAGSYLWSSTRPTAVAFTDTSTAAAVKYTVSVASSDLPLALPVAGGVVQSITHADFSSTYGHPKTCAAYAGRMFFAGVRTFPARLYYTRVAYVGDFTQVDPLNPVSSDGGTIDMQLVDGGEIIALKHLYDMMLVFTTRGVYRLVTTTGTVPFKAIQISTQVALSQHAVVQADNELYVLTRSGVQRFSTSLTYGDIKSEEITPSISDVFDTADAWELKGAFGVFDRSARQVHFFFQSRYVPVGGKPNTLPPEFTLAQAQAAGQTFYPPSVSTCYTFNMRGGSWERHYFPFYIDYAVARDRGDGNIVVEGYTRKDAATGVVSATVVQEHELFVAGAATDSGTAIDAYVRTRKLTLDALSARKTRLFLSSYVKSGTPAAAVSFDDAPFTQVTPALPTGVSRVAAIGSGHIAQIEYSGGAPWELNATAPDLKKLGRR